MRSVTLLVDKDDVKSKLTWLCLISRWNYANRTSPTGGEANQVGPRDVDVFFWFRQRETQRPLLFGSGSKAWHLSVFLPFGLRSDVAKNVFYHITVNGKRNITQNSSFKMNTASRWWVFILPQSFRSYCFLLLFFAVVLPSVLEFQPLFLRHWFGLGSVWDEHLFFETLCWTFSQVWVSFEGPVKFESDTSRFYQCMFSVLLSLFIQYFIFERIKDINSVYILRIHVELQNFYSAWQHTAESCWSVAHKKPKTIKICLSGQTLHTYTWC